MSQPERRRRSTIDVERPAREAAPGERWVVTVDQVRRPWGWSYEVIAELACERVPRQWDCALSAWVAAHDRVIPGVVVPPEPRVFSTLAAARANARDLASVLDGRLHPTWVEVQLPKPRG